MNKTLSGTSVISVFQQILFKNLEKLIFWSWLKISRASLAVDLGVFVTLSVLWLSKVLWLLKRFSCSFLLRTDCVNTLGDLEQLNLVRQTLRIKELLLNLHELQ